MNRKHTALACALVLTFALSGCSSNEAPRVTPTPSLGPVTGNELTPDGDMIQPVTPSVEPGVTDHGAIDRAEDTVGNVVGGAVEGTGDVVGGVLEGAGHAVEKAGEGVERATERAAGR